jgi:para-nitrobenzyl esterase
MPRHAVARITAGEVGGRARGGALLFAGIPYAEPPLAGRRFLPPTPHAGWSGVRDATRFGPAAPQRPGTGLTAAPLAWDEDCLTLNVCTPAVDDEARPVLVWIHGGGFRTGKGGIPWYDGTSFALRGDIVTVTINYRLGALGFANLRDVAGDDFAGSGAAGLLDQIAALAWVRDNVAAFGGDPGRVTIAGESAGAMSVGALLGSPAAAGLFHRAIAQSGAAHHTLSDAASREVGRDLAAVLGADSAAPLRTADVEAILDAQAQAEARFAARQRGGNGALADMAFQPALGTPALPEPPLDAIRRGMSAGVPLLCGSNAHETTLFGYGSQDEERLRRITARIFGAAADAAIATYRARRPGAAPGELVVAITSDQIFRIPAIRLCEAHAAAGGTSFAYLFTWASRAFEGRLGATHALEIPFAFNNLGQPGVDVFLGPGERPQALADAMHAAWIAFIRTGDPGCEALAQPWHGYDAARRFTLELGDAVRPLEDPWGAERALWQDVV